MVCSMQATAGVVNNEACVYYVLLRLFMPIRVAYPTKIVHVRRTRRTEHEMGVGTPSALPSQCLRDKIRQEVRRSSSVEPWRIPVSYHRKSPGTGRKGRLREFNKNFIRPASIRRPPTHNCAPSPACASIRRPPSNTWISGAE